MTPLPHVPTPRMPAPAWPARAAGAALLCLCSLNAHAQAAPASPPAETHTEARTEAIADTLAETLTAPTFSTPCSSAKAVHDMRCPNYAGFKARWKGAAPASPSPAPAPAAGITPGKGLPSGWRIGKPLPDGMASWYGPGFHGRRTANGETFDMHEFTAAHKTLPFGTRVLVSSPRTGKQVVVRINDRGPFAKGRVIDLSKAAAKELGIQSRGHDKVLLYTLTRDTGSPPKLGAD